MKARESMHEIIFENRNKQYGAYVIRNSYNDTVIKSLVCTICFFLSLVTSAVIYNKLTEKPELIAVESDYGNLNERLYDATPFRPHTAAAPVHSTRAALPPRIVDEPRSQPQPDPNQNANIPVTGNGGGSDSSAAGGSGGGNVPVVPPPVVNAEPVLIAEEMPVFKGGMDKLVPYLSGTIVYPERAKMLGIEGTVFVSFVVDEEGNVEKVKILKGIGGDCDEEAVRVVGKMPKWKPGKNAGQPVKVRFNLPIRFRLN